MPVIPLSLYDLGFGDLEGVMIVLVRSIPTFHSCLPLIVQYSRLVRFRRLSLFSIQRIPSCDRNLHITVSRLIKVREHQAWYERYCGYLEEKRRLAKRWREHRRNEQGEVRCG